MITLMTTKRFRPGGVSRPDARDKPDKRESRLSRFGEASSRHDRTRCDCPWVTTAFVAKGNFSLVRTTVTISARRTLVKKVNQVHESVLTYTAEVAGVSQRQRVVMLQARWSTTPENQPPTTTRNVLYIRRYVIPWLPANLIGIKAAAVRVVSTEILSR